MAEELSNLVVMVAHPQLAFRKKVSSILMKVDPRLRCIEAEDGQDALNRAKKIHVDIAIVSLNLPKLSGAFLINKMFELDQIEPPRFFLALKDPNIEGGDEPPKLDNLTLQMEPMDETALNMYLQDHLAKCRTSTQKAARTQAKIDVNFINPFIAGTLEVLKVTCQTEARKERIYVRGADAVSGDISAVVGMVGTGVKGSMGIAFKKHTYLKVVSNMLGEPVKEITSENQDACAEICNQVFGIAKRVLNQQGFDIQPAIPSIVVGDNHRVKHIVDGLCIAVEFATEYGTFTVEAAVG